MQIAVHQELLEVELGWRDKRNKARKSEQENQKGKGRIEGLLECSRSLCYEWERNCLENWARLKNA